MARMIHELKKLSTVELRTRIQGLKLQLVDQKRSRAAQELANPHAIRKTRREIAMALTLLNEMVLNARSDAPQPKKEEEA